MIAQIVKRLGVPILGAVVLFAFLAKFSAVEFQYECIGEFNSGENTEAEKIFIRLETYRPWVGLWSDSDGSLWLEMPNEHVEYFDNLRKVAESYQLHESQYGGKVGLRGNFSTLSNALRLNTYKGVFDGYCEQLG